MRLSPRERIIVFAGAFAVVAVAVWALAVDPIQEKLALLDRTLEYEQGRKADLDGLARRYAELNGRLAPVEARLKHDKGFSILSYIEAQAQTLNVKRNIVQMKPKAGQTSKHFRESLVEIKMEKIPLEQLMTFLSRVEASPEMIRVSNLQLRPRFDNPNLMDAKFQIASFEPPEKP